MGYYMRFIVTDDTPLSLGDLDAALKSLEADYAVKDGDLYHGDQLYAELEINPRGDALCDEELDELQEAVEAVEDGQERLRVTRVLQEAKAIIAVRVLWQGRDTESTLEWIDPLWEWLFATREGLMQADDEGYYDEAGLILRVE